MIKGGGSVGARTRQPPTANAQKKKSVWVRGVVCRSTQTQTVTVVACVILQCILISLSRDGFDAKKVVD
jgi:hypothetical protein